MANWTDLIAAIQAVIKQNGNQEITGTILQSVLTNLVSNVGADATYKGEATPATVPGTPDGNVFYMATKNGIYPNFNGYVVNNQLTVFTNKSGQWVGQSLGVMNNTFVMAFINSITYTNLLSPNLDSFYLTNRLDANGGTLIANTGFTQIVTSKGIPIIAGQTYVVSGSYYPYNSTSPIRGSITTGADFTGSRYAPTWTEVTGGYKFTAPVDGYLYVDFELNSSLTELKSNSQITATDTVLPYITYGQYYIKATAIPKLADIVAEMDAINARFDEIITSGKNMIDPAKIDFTKYYSPGSTAIATRVDIVYAITGYIPVVEGQSYTISPLGGSTGYIQYTGGYFANNQTAEAISSIAFENPSSGDGRTFTVPMGQGIKFVVLNLTCISATSNTLAADYQLEKGTAATNYLPYSPQINPDYLVDITAEITAQNEKIDDLQEQIDEIVVVDSFNKINPANILYDRRYSTGDVRIIAADPNLIAFSGLIPVVEGEWYTASGAGIFQNWQGGYFGDGATNAIGTAAIQNISWVNPVSGAGRCFQVPTGLGIKYVVVSLATNADKTGLAGDAQLEAGEMATAYQPYSPIKQINPDYLVDITAEITAQNEKIDDLQEQIDEIVVVDSFNKINPANILYDRRYSTGDVRIIAADPNLIAFSGLIPVVEGEWYTASGAGIFQNWQGGYFGDGATNAIGTAAIQNISWVNPVSGAGRCFQVPTGLGIKYVVVSLATNADKTGLAGDAQLEAGEMATAYQPYSPIKQINPDLLPDNPTPEPTETSELLKYTTFGNLNYNGLADKIPNFRKHWYAKDKNLCVVNTGTSLTARSIEHCTDNVNAATRPPLMHSNNFATHIWDALVWEGQNYRRYDSGFFAEVGTWLTASNIAEWDDGAYRSGLTRYSDVAGSQISFVVPVNAWQFNFIYRTDSAGSENCVVTIAEGNGKMEVMNDAGIWVEANGYTFSQREPDVVTLPTVNYTNPINGNPATLSNYQVKGNTTYQKRLYMRCKSGAIDSRTTTKAITISRTSGRLMYWGVEWSDREFMITYINAARGSHGSAISLSTLALNHYQDNEVWGFKPDLLLTEDAIHNAGGAGVPSSSNPRAYYGRVTENFFVADNGISMKARCETLGLDVPEMVLFNTSITWNFGGIDDAGNLKLGVTNDGYMWTALDAQSGCYMHMIENYPDIVYINAVKHFVRACYDCYGDMKTATVGSGKAGKTFTNEGSHWNDTGSRVMARVVLPILDMIV